MKSKKHYFKWLAVAAVSMFAGQNLSAQTNIGASCGCPTFSSRPQINISTLTGFTAISGTYGGELTSGATLSCANTYVLDQKIYIPSGQTLTIQPGTVILGKDNSGTGVNQGPAYASALVIEKGGKIMAAGTESCPIIFTAQADPLDGTYPIYNNGKWGGIVILGKATNNLTYGANGPFLAGSGNGKLAAADGIGVVEGFATSNTQDQFGMAPGSFDDNDNSGIMKYVSIRHSGAILSVGSEINGLTLGSVGRGTTLEHIEIVSCGDDAIEMFGGTVNLKWVTQLYGNDDMFDYDLGWSGKCQFLFGMKAPWAATGTIASPDSDNGFEADSDDQQSNNGPKSHPVIYNATIIGNGKLTNSSDNKGLAAIQLKEDAEIEIYNSIFANFKNGLNLENPSKVTYTNGDSYASWSNGTTGTLATATATLSGSTIGSIAVSNGGSGYTVAPSVVISGGNGSGATATATISGGVVTGFNITAAGTGYTSAPTVTLTFPAYASNGLQTAKVKCNTFVGMVNPLTVGAANSTSTPTLIPTTSSADYLQFTTADKNTVVSTLPGFSATTLAFSSIATSNAITAKNDVIPTPALALGTGCSQAPSDGFYEPTTYRGAFASENDNWLTDWSYSNMVGAIKGIVACPTDLNLDGVTDVNDFLIFAPAFGTSCN
jgi:hypothetical protein